MKFYQFTLPLPISVNAMHTVRRGEGAKRYTPSPVEFTRSKEYKDWLIDAGIAFRKVFAHGLVKFTGRVRVDYCFVWQESARGASASDIANREKVLSDFLQGKVYDNDNQIDEQGHYRRYVKVGQPHVIVRVTEIPDRRYDDPALIFEALNREEMFPTLNQPESAPSWKALEMEAKSRSTKPSRSSAHHRVRT